MTERLRALEHRAFEQGAEYFGVAFHEHDLCSSGSLTLTREALDGLRAYLDERIRPAAECLRSRNNHSSSRCPAVIGSTNVLGQEGQQRHGIGSWANRNAHPSSKKEPSLEESKARIGPNMEWVEVNKRAIVLQASGSTQPRAICLMSHAGRNGGIRAGTGTVWTR